MSRDTQGIVTMLPAAMLCVVVTPAYLSAGTLPTAVESRVYL